MENRVGKREKWSLNQQNVEVAAGKVPHCTKTERKTTHTGE